ncbi:MAG: hypothetical protein MUF75_03380 [Bacteroidia bacterium]|jgi:hypothetical protein|nr:hypothetical protein [Bacteroidia bacterium]
MQNLKQKIKCHRYGNLYQQPHFFILNKGNNSGKPISNWCPNCFVFLADTERERLHFYSLCKALWIGGYFKPLLIGSVIPFIHIDKFVMTLHHANILIEQDPDKLFKIIHYFNELDKQEESIRKQVALIHQLRQTIVYKLFLKHS